MMHDKHANTHSLKFKDIASLWPPCQHPNLSIKSVKGSEKILYICETQVERATSKIKPLFSLLMVESNTSEVVKPLHPLAQSLLKEFEDVFPNYLPLSSLLLEKSIIKLTIYWLLICPTNRFIAITLMRAKGATITSPRVA